MRLCAGWSVFAKAPYKLVAKDQNLHAESEEFDQTAQADPSSRWTLGYRRLVTDIPTAEYLSAWQVLGNLEIAEVLRDYVASSPQREQICLFLSSWLGISK